MIPYVLISVCSVFPLYDLLFKVIVLTHRRNYIINVKVKCELIVNLNILYSDKDILVVEKPAGVAVQTAKLTEKDMVSEIKNHLSIINKKPDPYLGIIHRLDQPVRGILVFALNEKAASRLSKQISTGSFNKFYHAYVTGYMEKSDEWMTLTDYLIKDKDNKAGIVNINDKNAKKAELKYRILKAEREKNVSLLDIELITGRFHQIRVQLSHIGHPILNDVKYGADKNLALNNERAIALCAYRLSFKHPETGREMEFSISESFSDDNIM